MGCLVDEGMAICGNFAERLAEKPKDFDFEQDAKWYEDYPFDWRETIGGTVCSCTRVKTNYTPWHGYDHFHTDGCQLLRKLEDNPQMSWFYKAEYLPTISHWEGDVASDAPIRLYIKGRSSSSKIKVRLSQRCANQLQMQLGGIA